MAGLGNMMVNFNEGQLRRLEAAVKLLAECVASFSDSDAFASRMDALGELVNQASRLLGDEIGG